MVSLGQHLRQIYGPRHYRLVPLGLRCESILTSTGRAGNLARPYFNQLEPSMKHQQTVSRQIYRKPGVDHLLSQLSEHEIAERVARRQRLIYRLMAVACVALIGLQFL